MDTIRAVIKLTRWREHIPFVLPLTILGTLVGLSVEGGAPDIKILAVVLGNVLAVTYAFMINDVEDAQDDARDPVRRAKNPISNGDLTTTQAYTALRVTATLAVIAYTFTNGLTLGIGILTLLLSHLYSWKRVRLKAYPVADLASHSLMLSGLLVAAGFTSYSGEFKSVWLLVAAATLFSIYGQLYNQLRDYELDKKARLRNTTILLGKKNAQYLMNASIVLSTIAVLTTVYYGTFPVWLLIPAAVGAPIVFSFRAKKDMRGTATIDMSGSLQLQLTLLFNIIMIAWLAYVLVLLYI